MTRHALVTGGAGFIASHLVDALLVEGWTVSVVDNFDTFYDRAIKERNVAPWRDWHSFHFLEADLRDADRLRSGLTGDYDVVVHLAAKAGVRPSIERPLEYAEVNVGGTQTLLELCREWIVRQVVFASSSSVYGINERVPWREDDCVLRPISPYASSKVGGELLGHVYAALYDMRFVALRLFTVYGPRQRPDLAIHQFARRMLRGEPITMFGSGTTRRDYTYVGDIVPGIRAAMDYAASQYEIINLGSDHPISLANLVAALERALGVRAQVEHVPDHPGDLPQTWADITKAQRLLGYAASTPLDSGLQQFATWLRASGW